MAAIRHVRIRNFRGFKDFETSFPPHAVLVGEPGAGRSDLIEALIRTLDPDSLRGRYGSELDLFNVDRSHAAVVEVTIGDLKDDVLSTLFHQREFWDRKTGTVVASLPAGAAPNPETHEPIVRFGYRLAIEEGQPNEIIYFPKFADSARGEFPRVGLSHRSLIPFLWQRGMSTRPLDLAGRGELRGLIDRHTGEEFDDAVDRFVETVKAAAADFSSQERVAAALQAILMPLRGVRRFDAAKTGAELIRFLPDGGGPSGLLRSLASAITLLDSPQHFPALRHGSTLLAALRGGVLHAAATTVEGAIIAIDDFGGEFDPYLARHLAGELRRSAGQVIVATHSAAVASSFATDEVMRLYRQAGIRRTASPRKPIRRQDRIAARYLTSTLVEAFNASAVVVVEGHHDRMAYAALKERAVAVGRLESLDAAGVSFAEAEGDGEAPKVARAARDLAIFTIVLLDNDKGIPAAMDVKVKTCLDAADAVLRLPPKMAVEQLLFAGVSDSELIRVFTELNSVFGDLALPPNWADLSGSELLRVLSKTLHDRPGSLHASYVWELNEAELPTLAIDALRHLRQMVIGRQVGLIEM
jgi:hypothetical protein